MPFEVVKEQCNMESGETGQAMVYKLEGEQRTPFACHADEASAYAAIAAIEAADEAKQIDDIINQMAEMIDDPETMVDDEPIEEQKEFGLGDMVHFIDGDGDGFGIIENLDAEANVYTVRVYATAGDQMEPTDQLLNLPLENLHDAEDYLEGEVEEEIDTELETDAEDMPDEMKVAPGELTDGDFVKWESAGGEAQGKVIQIATEGSLNVPDSEFTVEATAEDPAALIEVFERVEGGWRSSGVVVGHRFSTLSKIDPLEEAELPKSRIVAKMKSVKMDMEVSDDGKVGIIEGFASTYGNTDLGGDVVEKGAFKQTLNHKQGIVPLLLDHGYNTRDVAGVAMLEDQEKGLYMKAEMPLDDPEVNAAYKKIKFMLDRGAKMGLSIGYDTIKSMPGEDGTRLLKEVALHEVSITPFPMNTEAQIMAAKSRKSKSKIKQALWQKTITRPVRPVKRTADDYTSLLGDIKNLINEFKNL
jgi:HK97 family phage prohead protease